MRAAAEYQVIRPGLFYWQAYEPAVKTELCCCAIETPAGLVFCDPVPLERAALEELTEGGRPHAIVLTNGNHERGAAAVARRFGIEVWASEGAKGEVGATRWFWGGGGGVWRGGDGFAGGVCGGGDGALVGRGAGDR